MVEDQACIERLEKANQELQEKHAKSCDDISQMMKMLTKDKQSAEASNPQIEATSLRDIGEDTCIHKFSHFLIKPKQLMLPHHKLFPLTMDLLKLLILPEWSHENLRQVLVLWIL